MHTIFPSSEPGLGYLAPVHYGTLQGFESRVES